MRRILLIMAFLLMANLLIACNSNDENEANNEGNDSVVNNETPDNENTDSKRSGKFGDGKVLSLGETGKVESTLGDYEVTFESFQLLDELGGEEADGVLVLMNATVEITGDEPLESSDLYSAKLFNDGGLNAGSTSYFNDSINRIEGTLEPGDIEEGQFIFEIPQGDSYKLILNYGLDGVATEITWKFSADEASN